MAFNPITYIKESKAELDKVVWPSRVVTLRLTLAVLAISIAVGVYIGLLDTILTKITGTFIK